MIGKVDPDRLDRIFQRLGATDPDVLQGPGYGEDTAALRIGGETLVCNVDPISLAAERAGTLGVHVAANDVAASGADPRWLAAVVVVPGDRPEILETVTDQLDAAATDLGVAIVGGHSEYDPDRSRPFLSLTCMGLADRYIPSAGAEPGDHVVVTKGAGIEGTAILATDFREQLLAAGVERATIETAAAYFEEISVVPEARIARERATAMHDPTEGGMIDGLLELAVASGATVEIDRSAVPVREPTRRLCAAMDVDPLSIFGSGALVATVPKADAEAVVADLDDAGIAAATVGRVTEGGRALRVDGETYRDPVRDDLYDLWR